MDWRIKGGIQKVLGGLPGGDWLHYRLQRTFGGLRRFEGELDGKVEDWRIMAGHLADAGIAISDAHVLEIGTGWYPTFPFACYLGGARTVTTVDLTRHLKPDLVRACALRLGGYLDDIARHCVVNIDDVRSRHDALMARLAVSDDLGEVSGGVIRYTAPGDATDTGLPPDEVDCIFSNSVLEHVPPAAIDAMYREAMRILKPGGVMFHSVNCGDHYAYVDAKVSQLNYLKYSDAQWAFWNNAFLYQNRMRAHAFVERAIDAGFDIELNTARPNEIRLRELKAVNVHEQFEAIAPERLCITSVDFIARRRMSIPA